MKNTQDRPARTMLTKAQGTEDGTAQITHQPQARMCYLEGVSSRESERVSGHFLAVLCLILGF